MGTLPADPRCRAVLEFWFGDARDDAAVIADKGAQWFRGGAQVDAAIRDRFADTHAAAVAGKLDDWLPAPRGRLALVLLIDQFSRNLFRDDPRAFEHDALALAWCRQALASGADRALRPIERVFLYLPLEHSEELADQERAVALFTALRDAVDAGVRERFEGFLDYAVRHRDIVARFGRFPHRNAILGRPSTAAELEFLKQPGASF
ncbi:DUF924 family protein [Dokdonella sp.]|uniref:DUF924 family protein n=1 Tax=Dokdonella sp. TaxID=2291710 RepID=UPI0031BF335D|nr:DUF924 domain-containing protein [Dokdonella sp.]